MKGSYCYMPILKARGGTFSAVRTVSPAARARFAPLFDIAPPNPAQARNPRAYLKKKVQGIVGCWTPDRPVYLDAHDFAVDTLIDALPPVANVAQGLRGHGFAPIPVVGTVNERGDDYVRLISSLAASLGNGACIRVERDDVLVPTALRDALSDTLNVLGMQAEQTDLVLDLDYVGKDSSTSLYVTALEVLQVTSSIGAFRNVVFAGGSIPPQLPKADTGKVRREPRVEIEAWLQLQAMADLRTPLAFGDFGIINSGYVKPGRPVNVPARVRYTTAREHILLRTGRKGHGDLCKQLLAMEGDYSGAAFSAGDQRMSLAAQGLASPGSPAIWVAGDLSHHLELVSAQVWAFMKASGSAARFALPEPRRYPWLQPLLVDR